MERLRQCVLAWLGLQEPEQTEALPLVVSTPKKKRSKVTDTRLSPRAARALLQDSLHHHHHHHHSMDSFSASNSVSHTRFLAIGSFSPSDRAVDVENYIAKMDTNSNQ